MGCASSKADVQDNACPSETQAKTEQQIVHGAAEQHPAADAGKEPPQACSLVLWRDGDDVPLPADEQQRWDQLSGYNILDTEPEEAYDSITELCRTLFKVPIAMVTFVDRDRVWLKSVQGLTGFKEVNRRVSICAWTLLSRFPEALVVPDLREDVRFKDFPVVVGPPHARFYAASPLVNSSRTRLGTLCILDFQPRKFSAESASLLAQLAALVMRELERKAAINTARCSAALAHASGLPDHQAVMLLDTAAPKWAIYLVNDAWQRVTGISQEMAVGSHFWDLFQQPPPAQVQAYQLAVEQRRNFELRVPCHVGQQLALKHGSLPQLPAAPGGWASASSEGEFESGSDVLLADASRRRGAGGQVVVRFQFRSVSSVAQATPVSIPPALLSRDSGSNFYWSTADIPAAALPPEDQPSSRPWLLDSAPAASAQCDSSLQSVSSSLGCGSAAVSSGQGGGDDSSSVAGLRTTFSLLPEDNPFQDITIGSLLGWGSYGRVHRGYWNGSLVAVKVLEQVAGDCNPRSSLEPLLHHRLSHPNIVAMFDVCTQEVDLCEDGQPLQEVWMVLEFCNRGTLADAMSRGWLLSATADGVPQQGQVDMLRCLTTAREVAAAMEYLHSQNILHGDLNGNNILLAGGPADGRGFTAKVADFGLSRILTPENEKIITRTHGTITNMAPEVITEATHSKAADVYSFGVVLFELVSGTKPYAQMHYAQIVSSITSGRLLQLLPQHAGHLPAPLQQLLAHCLATQPADRPTFHQVHTTLQQLEQQELAALASSTAMPAAPHPTIVAAPVT